MSLDNLMRWVFFCMGIITAIFAGYMFYIDRISAGSAWLALSMGFLVFATRVKREEVIQVPEENLNLHDMAIIISDLAVASLKNIGRTVSPSEREISELEEKINSFLDTMPVTESERLEITQEFDRIKDRTRRNSSGRALFKKL